MGLEEGRDTRNGASCRVAQNVAVLDLLLVLQQLILMALAPILTKQLYGVQIAFSIILSVLVFAAWIRLGWPGILHGVKGRIQVFLMLLLALIVNGMPGIHETETRLIIGFSSVTVPFLQFIFFFFCFFVLPSSLHVVSSCKNKT